MGGSEWPILLGILNSSRLWETDPSQGQTWSETRCEVTKPTDPHASQSACATSADLPAGSLSNETVEGIILATLLEEAQVATGATGAAIALVRGAEMVCCATTGPNAPDLGAWL